jgi:hypothetical protein
MECDQCRKAKNIYSQGVGHRAPTDHRESFLFVLKKMWGFEECNKEVYGLFGKSP